jgi:L-fucose mutarotase
VGDAPATRGPALENALASRYRRIERVWRPYLEAGVLKYRLLHPEILHGLGEAGHGAQVLIADGNYPLATRSHPASRRVYLNLAPDLVRVTDVLKVLADAIPIESAYVMMPDKGPEPAVFAEFRQQLPGIDLKPLGRFEFYDAARGPDLAGAIATGEVRVYANLLLTIGVVPPS